MTRNAEQTAKYAEGVTTYGVGMCLQYSRICADIPSKYPDASTAAKHAHLHKDRKPPRGSMCYWTGGSSGHGHIAPSLGPKGDKYKIRTSDAPTSGKVSTQDLGWVEEHWGLTYVGWAWDVNDVTIPHDEPKPPPEEDMPKFSRTRLTKPLKVKGGEWTTLPWDTVSSGDAGVKGNGYITFKDAGPFTAALSVVVTATGTGSIRTRMVERNKNDKGDWETAENYPGAEHAVTGGDTYITDTRVQNVKKDTRLLAQVQLPEDGTVKSADMSVLYF